MAEQRHSDGDEQEQRRLQQILERGLQRVTEALVFAADDAIQAVRIAEVYSDVTGEPEPSEQEVHRAVEQLNAAYEETDRTFRIEHWAGGLRMATSPQMAPYLHALFDRERQTSLSRSLMEALAIVAYRQPVTKPEVDFVRGVDSDYALRKLMNIGLIDVVGRSDSLGRPLLYGTTRVFLEQFGINTLGDLPNLREIEEILDDPAFNRERARLLQLEEEREGPRPLSSAEVSDESQEDAGETAEEEYGGEQEDA